MKDIFHLAMDKRTLIETLGQWGFLAKEGVLTCSKCGSFMKLVKHSGSVDEFKWACRKKVSIRKKKAAICNTEQTIRKNTILERGSLSLEQILVFSHLWTFNIQLEILQLETSISWATAIKLNLYCYEVVIDFGLRQQKPIGGVSMTVEIGETNFANTKYDLANHEQWVLGGICRETKDVFFVPIKSRDPSTLISLIIKWIVPGSTIISDCWHWYGGLKEASFQNIEINHSVELKDLGMEDHSNTIKSLWRHVRSIIPEYNRIEFLLPRYLAKFLFIRYCKINKLDRTLEFCKAAGQLYNPYKLRE